MDKNTATRLIQDVFQNPFNRDRFVTFTKNLFNFLDTEKNFVYRGNFIPDAYKPYINTLERIGKYEDAEENKIDVLIVHLKKEHSIEHARTMQRNFIAWYLGGSRGGELKDAALVAFYTDNPDDWRFSLVKMDYQIVESSTGKIKTKTELTPARRFSFLVGKNENSHTAQRQLLPILQDDKNNPLLSDLEKAFNIEVVTQEFFEKYKSLFLDVKDSLDRLMKKDQAIAKDFADKGVDPVDFSKKLLGQIVFLYFLQKKGWFGVERDGDWGTGPKNFLRLLFEKMIANYKNFFNDILEPLFYEALAKERDDDFYSRFNCKIPFLNGGLFDPLSDYDWVHTDILLPDELFSNLVRTKEGDTGTGILDIFDRYNFTVKEDEPLEKEVAVDPEMLGKVFENLLEVKDRKSKGTYYTPREIVHYMCQESLINYLVNECEGKVGRKDIETLIQYGETAVEHDSRVEQEGKETETYSYKLPESIRKNAQFLDDKLKNIRVCDPAIGSGAFPVGMMNEIIRTRNTLTNYLEDKKDRSIYNFKRDAIQNSLYGVDIDPGAVEIAKLRLWLSLVVDEGDIKQIKPLPNLDYKIMQGNSLLEEFEGVRLFDEELISKPGLDDDEQIKTLKQRQSDLQHEFIKLYSSGGLNHSKKQELEMELKKVSDSLKKLTRPDKPKSESGNLFDIFSEAKKKAQELKQLHKEFFEASQKTKKDELKRRIEKLEWDLIETTLKEQNKMSALKQLEQYRQTNIKPFFLWRLNFAEVFAEKGGFDIVIANPPYVTTKYGKISDSLKEAYLKTFYSAYDKIDLYVLFIEQSIRISKENGFTTLITPWNFLKNFYSFKIRKYILDNCKIILFCKLSPKVFGNIIVDNIISILQKSTDSLDNKILFDDLLDKSKRILVPQSEYKTSDNFEFFMPTDDASGKILGKMKNDSVQLGNIALNYIGIMTGGQKTMIADKPIFKNSKPVLSGKEIDKWFYKDIGRYVNFDKSKIHSNDNESVYLAQRKILLRKTGRQLTACLDENQYYTIQSLYNIVVRDHDYTEEYLLALLNSSLYTYLYNKFFITNPEVFPYIKRRHLDQLPVKKISEADQKPFKEIVDKILAITSSSDYLSNAEKQARVKDYEKQIDQLVYQLYGLTSEEIAVVEKR